MKKYIFLFLSLCLCVPSFAQTVSYGQQSESGNAVAAPPSSIDLIKNSLKGSDVASSASSSSAAVSTQTAVAAKSSAQQPAASSAAKTAASKTPVSQTAASSGGNFLEMPLSSGAVVKTQVPAAPVSKSSSRSVRTAKPAAKKTAVSAPKTAAKAATPVEQDIEKNNALIEGERTGSSAVAAGTAAESEQASEQTIAQEELDYAARMLRQSKEMISGGRFIPPSAAETAQTVPAQPSNRPFNPNDYRPGVEWKPSNTTHFTIYTQKRDNGISSSNMGMIFESAYTTLRRNIPWMMSDKVRVFVYQDHNSYLKHEPNAQAWTRALAYPTRGEIVVYDEPGKQQELKEVFTHELVHIFTQKFFDKHNTGRLMTPVWLDEGLAVYMEDQAYNGTKGGPWANDFKTLNFRRSKETEVANFSSSNMFGSARSFTSGQKGRGAPLYFMPFDQFMEDGSLSVMEGKNKTQDWYFQAYAMVRFLLNPSGGVSPSNRMQFEQFTRLMSQGEQVRDPRTGFPVRDRNGKPVYQPYSAEKAMARAYRYNTTANFEDAFWRWADGAR